MLHLPLSALERDALWATLRDSAQVRVDIGIYDADEKRVSSFDFASGQSQLESGSVQVDATQDVDRSLEVELVDDRHRMPFEPSSPVHGAIFLGYSVGVAYEIYVPPYGSWATPDSFPGDTFPGDDPATAVDGGWLGCEVFFGPLTQYEQVGAEIKIEAQGRESRMLEPFYAGHGFTLKGHQHTDNAITEVLLRAGVPQRKIDIPDMPWRIKDDRAVHPDSELWKVINGGEQDAAGHNVAGLIERTGPHPHHIYNDARGHTRVKRLNKEPVFTFDESTITTPVTWQFDALSGFANVVDVSGGKPKGKGKKRAHARVSLPAHHPLSPESTGATLIRFVTAPNLKTDRDCRQRGHHVLHHVAAIGLSASFDSLIIPMLEPFDVVRVNTPEEFAIEFPLKQFTFPLSADDMTVGDTERVRREGKSHKHRHGGDGGHHPGRHHPGRHHRDGQRR